LAEVPAVLLDLSAGGAGLSVGPSLRSGHGLLLRFGRPGLPALEVPAWVVYCAAQKGPAGAILGCRFLDPLSEDDVRSVLRAGA
ncbi:MAG: PilZ domain-containing protein, partial [Gemmataceae bacterium]